MALQRIVVGVALVALVVSLGLYVGRGADPARAQAEALEGDLAEIGAPERSSQLRHVSQFADGRVLVGSTYRSPLSEAALRAYYVPALASRGYVAGATVTEPGAHVSCFQRDERHAALAYATDPRSGFTYSLELSIGRTCP